MHGLEILNHRLHFIASDPALAPTEGDIWFNSTSGEPKVAATRGATQANRPLIADDDDFHNRLALEETIADADEVVIWDATATPIDHQDRYKRMTKANLVSGLSTVLNAYSSVIVDSGTTPLNASGASSLIVSGDGTILQTAGSTPGTNTVKIAWQTKVANRVLAGPSSGGAVAPTFRALVDNDLPSSYNPTQWDAAYTHSNVVTGNPHNVSVGDLVTLGTEGQIPYMLTGDTDFNYSANLTFSGTLLSVGGGITATGLITAGSFRFGVGQEVDTIETTLTNDHTHLPTSGSIYSLINSTEYNPSVLNVVVSDGYTGDIDSVQTVDDADVLQVEELSGFPGFDIRFTFTGVVAFNNVSLLEQYTGGQNHTIYVQVYNPTSTLWETISEYTDDGAPQYRSIAVYNGQIYNDAGTVIVRVYHLSNGNTSHFQVIDYIALYDHPQLGSGGGVTHHNGLTGLVDDDHPQYPLLDGRSGDKLLIDEIGEFTLDAGITSYAAKLGHYDVAEVNFNTWSWSGSNYSNVMREVSDDDGGHLTLNAGVSGGTSSGDSGGTMYLNAGRQTSAVGGQGGNVFVQAGQAGGHHGGAIALTGGGTTQSNSFYHGGHISITGGSASNGTGGHIYLLGGVGGAARGTIYFGNGGLGTLGNDEAETNLVAYDTATGLLTYRSAVSLTPTDNILEWDAVNNWYAPYAANQAGKLSSDSTRPVTSSGYLTFA